MQEVKRWEGQEIQIQSHQILPWCSSKFMNGKLKRVLAEATQETRAVATIALFDVPLVACRGTEPTARVSCHTIEGLAYEKGGGQRAQNGSRGVTAVILHVDDTEAAKPFAKRLEQPQVALNECLAVSDQHHKYHTNARDDELHLVLRQLCRDKGLNAHAFRRRRAGFRSAPRAGIGLSNGLQWQLFSGSERDMMHHNVLCDSDDVHTSVIEVAGPEFSRKGAKPRIPRPLRLSPLTSHYTAYARRRRQDMSNSR